VRRFSFHIDLRKKDGDSSPKKPRSKSTAPEVADGFEMSGDLAERRQFLRAWPSFQRHLLELCEVTETLEPWDDPHLGAEYVRIYQVSKQKILDAEPGFSQQEKMETHCFFTPDGTKHFVSRLLSRPHDRLSEIRLNSDGELVRLYYEKSEGPAQSLDDLFEHGMLGLEDDVARFARYPNYVLRFFLMVVNGEYLDSTFRGVCYYDPQSGQVLTEEAGSLG